MLCNKCGKELPDNVKFCTGCGNKMDGGNTSLPTEPTKPTQSATEPNKQKNKNTLPLVLIAIGVIGLIVLLGKLLLNSDDSSSDNSVNTSVSATVSNDTTETFAEPTPEPESIPEPTKVIVPVNISIQQVDSASFPIMKLYTNIIDDNGVTVDNIQDTDLVLYETLSSGAKSEIAISNINKIINSDNTAINIVMDISGSMDGTDKIGQAKSAVSNFLGMIRNNGRDLVELTTFDNYVYVRQPFTSNIASLQSAVNSINVNGGTALYDAIYSALMQTHYQSGSKCVIVFTDGHDNDSSYSYNDVINLSKNTNIPVYIVGIGIGNESDSSNLATLAQSCSGKYFYADFVNLYESLSQVYSEIYTQNQEQFVIEYTTVNTDLQNEFRDVMLASAENSSFNVTTQQKAYIPVADIAGGFQASYINMDYILPNSQNSLIPESDLHDLSLAQLRIARNEIYARHGRQFKDQFLNQWFYSKLWYLSLSPKYSPTDFDKRGSVLSSTELKNIDTIVIYEKHRMTSRDIFENPSNVLLSEYDLALAKDVLKLAQQQLNNQPNTAILQKNKQLIQEAIDKTDIKY